MYPLADGDRWILCPLRYSSKGTDIGADDKPLAIFLGLTKLERCREIRLGGAYDGESQIVD